MPIADRLQRMRPSYIRDILRAASADNVLSLAGGLPALELFPMRQIEAAMQTVGKQAQLFQYGETRGYPPLLDYLRDLLAIPADHDLLISNGSQQGLDLIARAFLNPGDVVVVEAPCYLGALQVFELADAAVRLVAQTPQGPDLQQLESLFAAGDVRLFYAVPDFHNPTGICWSLATRERVAALCEQFGVLLVEDAPYRNLRFAGEELPLVAAALPSQALVLRSSSKISTPGMRLGMVSGPRQFIDALVLVKQAADLHTNVPLQAALLEVISQASFPRHLARLRVCYRRRYRALLGALQAQGWQPAAVCGGMFVWLELEDIDARALAAEALRCGVAVVPGEAFYPADVAVRPALRLNFTHCNEQAIEEAVARLAVAIETLQRQDAG
ncbi:PLP-dependent aminotransferase family protein [Halieaceae bacterium IMCC14734]|uniref:PLP-dependent aminotransferase family protein n=1 Tax=Candidatus Litorirhabdus singularis TaxID=2518993 RepID=A0ABT3TK60_9GAMM|nr:PLP-dependent aminotransferase family protein [Candidatus Litorirhabdus singularis]